MKDKYKNFRELKVREVEDKAFSIRTIERYVLIMAIHGGNIEPCTTQIAEAIAGKDYSLYSFEGLKPEEGVRKTCILQAQTLTKTER